MSQDPKLLALVAVAVVLAGLLARGLWLERSRKREEMARAKRKRGARKRKRASEAASASGRASEKEGALPKPSAATEDDDGVELTRLRVTLDEETSHEPTVTGAVVPIVYDEEAATDEPTQPSAFILVSAVGQTDRGRRRKRNEDSFAIVDQPPVYVVADGMGGYAGGDVASSLAVDELRRVFEEGDFAERGSLRGIPRRGAELVHAIKSANSVVWQAAQDDPALSEMGTTIVAARFSPNKQRVYVGHVGDSRCYVMRDGKLHQVTTDHTAAQHGVVGPLAATLTRALGIKKKVAVDLILGKPTDGDRYLICSDGLSKMLNDDEMATALAGHPDPRDAVELLIASANEHGGKDNITVIVIDVRSSSGAAASRG